MALFRFGISILANLIMTVIGGFLTYLGSVGLFLTLQVYLFLETDLPGSEATVNDALGAMNGGRIDLFAEVTPWLIMVGELVVGLPLLVFGILGLLRRLKAGLPDEDEGAAETSIGRIAQALVYLAGGAVGLYLLIFVLLDIVDYAYHEANSERAEAVIERNWKSNGENADERLGTYATYRFRTHAGESFVTKVRVPNLAGKHFAEGKKIIVRYLPGDPNINEWEGLRSFSDFVLPLILYSILVIGGLWGVKRNLLDDAESA